MGWSKLYSNLHRHRKVRRLADKLKRDKFGAIGVLISVYNTAVDQQPDGDFSEWSDRELEAAIEWRGRKGAVMSGLIGSGLAGKDRVLHEWMEYAGNYREALRKRDLRLRKKLQGDVPGPSQDGPGTVPPKSHREEKEREKETRGRRERDESDPGHADAVRAVFRVWKDHHPRSFPKIHSRLKEWKLISARLADGYDAADLIDAVEGMHRTPYNLGMNEQGKKYLSLELCMRDAKHVEQYRDAPEKPPQPMTTKTMANRAAIMSALNSRREKDEERRDRGPVSGRRIRHLGTGSD